MSSWVPRLLRWRKKRFHGESQWWSRRLQNRCSVGGWEFMGKEISSLLCSMINKKCLPHHHHLNSAGLDYFLLLLQCADELLIKLKCTGFPVTSCQHHNTQKSCFWKRKEKGIRNFESFLCVCSEGGVSTQFCFGLFSESRSHFFFKSWQIYHKISNTLKFVLCNLQKLTFSHSQEEKWYSFVNTEWWEHLACNFT